MKVTTSWLTRLIKHDCGDAELVDHFNSLGLEVDAVYTAPTPFSGIVVGRVENLEQHPNREDLLICTVLTDSKSNAMVQVVCGDQTLKLEERVVVAQDGAKLPDGRVIKKTRIHGVESNGMLCSGRELAISSVHETVWRMSSNQGQIGECPGEALLWNDSVLDLDLTPNRGDCFSVVGLARELALVVDEDYENPLASDSASLPQTHSDRVSIEVQAREACPIYHGIVVKNVPQDTSNLYRLRKDLTCCGLRPVNYVVDCLNYELLETGQPTHAFDLEKVKDGIIVRFARAGEKILLLDGTDVTLDASTLVIASGDKPVAIAGVMGSLDSAVTDDTKDILLEVAYFTPDAVRGTARKYGLQSEASLRFERGVDFSIQSQALHRACQRLAAEVPSSSSANNNTPKFGPVVSVVSECHLPPRPEILLPIEFPQQRIGYALDADKMNQMFEGLEFSFRLDDKGWWITPPTHRYDIEIAEDFVEEICRIHGYDNIPSQPLRATVHLQGSKRIRGDSRELRASLSTLGYNEAMTYSFIHENANEMFSNYKKIPKLTNPISLDRSVMRCSIIPGLLSAVAYNTARQESALRLFEYGQCFEYDKSGDLLQRDKVAGVLLGTRNPEGWASSRESIDFYDVKADLESLLCYTKVDFDKVDCKWLQSGHSACVKVKDQIVGVVGKLKQNIAREFEIDQEVYAFELDATLLLRSEYAHFSEFSPFPSVRRDLAFVLDKSVTIREIETVVRESLNGLLWDFVVFDVFGGSQFADNQHSVGIGITLRHQSRTLQDEEVNNLINEVVDKITTQFHAKLRT
ncbi:MAG: phenylalanine--tRNA ligase subunit beta [Gammaproteobacteria bacterium]|nr:phenylalanine--tRNA ligase subunit beta [Gammaproteobacteria bacterium]MXW06696.1 phenylalanine--tRNA ligase subunit beta [Gammaproteobacteria bacterium]MYC25921.1 phenylalanine--tRNA ligase subunit beta [Gammaproteobacteria bacterium]